MKIILHKYIFNEIWPTFLVSLFVCVFIVLATKMLSITELIVSKGVNVALVGRMILFLMPDLISFALPAATLMSVLLAFVRLGADSELIAMKSAGISLYQLLPPVIFISTLALLLSLWLGIVGVPWGNRSFKNLLFQIAENKADVGIRERLFSEPFDKLVFYVNSFSRKDRTMRDIFVVDNRDPKVTSTIIAKSGRVFLQPKEKIITLRFLDGTIFLVDKDLESARTIQFRTYDLNIGLKDIMAALSSRKKSAKEMGVGELINELKSLPKRSSKWNLVMIKLLEKGSLPLGVFLMGLIAVPLGARIQSRGKSKGIGLSLVVFLIYYFCFAGMKNLCEANIISPEIGVWIPDLFLLVLGVWLLRLVANEKPSRLLSFINKWQVSLRQWG